MGKAGVSVAAETALGLHPTVMAALDPGHPYRWRRGRHCRLESAGRAEVLVGMDDRVWPGHDAERFGSRRPSRCWWFA